MTDFIEVTATYRRKLIYGCGINDATYVTSPVINGKKHSCPYYRVWNSMLRRCYSLNYQQTRPTYKGCSVCVDWLLFSNFKLWMLQQDWKGKQLDKDLLVRGNKIYSPETCIFVSVEVNSLLNTQEASRGLYKQGVCCDKAKGKFLASCNVAGIRKYLGYFNTEEEASKAYRRFKYTHIVSVVQEQTNQQLKEALLHHASLYLDEVC
jgi:hypothetical protein